MKILLASQSPRRKELLANLGFDFDVVKIDCEEILPQDVEADKAAEYLSELKAKSFQDIKDDEILLTADTVVVFAGKILGKPKNTEEAFETLKLLSGKSHQVYTAVTIKTKSNMASATDVATVYFDEISDDEIKYYIHHYQPLDKAGSYGIQEWIGMAKVSRIEGSFYTIMGLPTHLVYKLIHDANN